MTLTLNQLPHVQLPHHNITTTMGCHGNINICVQVTMPTTFHQDFRNVQLLSGGKNTWKGFPGGMGPENGDEISRITFLDILFQPNFPIFPIQSLQSGC